MIQIELPCCDTPIELEAEAETVRCESCGVELAFAPDDRPAAADQAPPATALAIAA